jgi:hypothetical protein
MRCVTPHEVEALGELIAARFELELTCEDRASRGSETALALKPGPSPGAGHAHRGVAQTGTVISGTGSLRRWGQGRIRPRPGPRQAAAVGDNKAQATKIGGWATGDPQLGSPGAGRAACQSQHRAAADGKDPAKSGARPGAAAGPLRRALNFKLGGALPLGPTPAEGLMGTASPCHQRWTTTWTALSWN